MASMILITLLLVSVSVQAKDSAETELEKLTSDIKSEYEIEREIIEEDRKHVTHSDDEDDEEATGAYQVQRLNSTERDLLEKALRNITEELRTLEDQTTGKQPDSSAEEYQHYVNSSGGFKSLDDVSRRRLEMKLSINILTAIKIVDDEIVNKELGLSMEIRQKRSLERNSLLAAIDKELETGSKILGLHKDREEQEKSRAKRGVLELLARRTCSHRENFVSSVYHKAKNLGKTVQVGVNGKIGIYFTASANVAHTYGPRGEFGCAAKTCTGWSTDIGISVGTMAGYYNYFSDVNGGSVAKLYTVSFILSYTYGTIENLSGRKIGTLSRVGLGFSFTLFSYARMSCDCIMTTPDCSRTTISYQEKYSKSCGWWGWSRCARYRTAYRYHHYC
ncbi:uncharacterized protein LOC134181280 [Corticium candelabrum]|uniref:uncharacterized protein LOC134181280 n=1 Tax=Corticium candelabrum TaxID=121492 RepID=UPI002E25B7F6|nr:uncharacterized protein LOC134181280 [Corticium candelabrum]